MNRKVIFNQTILNILNNSIPYETITLDDKEAPCFSSTIKTFMQEMNEIFKTFSQKYQNILILQAKWCKMQDGDLKECYDKYFFLFIEMYWDKWYFFYCLEIYLG